MSATTAEPAATFRTSATGSLSFAGVLRSEWTKLWSLRSTRWSLFVACVFMAGLGPLVAAITMARWNQLAPYQRLSINPIDRSLVGYHLSQLAIAVLGVMVITGEYSTGSIRSTLMAVPKRLPVFWAKIIVFSSVAFVLMLVTGLIGFYGSQALYTQHHVNVALGSPHAFRTYVGTLLFITTTGILCTAFGTIIRSTAGAISAYVGLMFVLPVVNDILPSSISNVINPYMPSNAGGGVAMAFQDAHTFSPWGGFALFCGYVTVAVVVAAALLKRRDA